MINPSIIEAIIILISLKLKLTISKWPIIKIKVTNGPKYGLSHTEQNAHNAQQTLNPSKSYNLMYFCTDEFKVIW